jgi:S-DNA-T family DNA segregation ATPase FtsK/SpoIIIE
MATKKKGPKTGTTRKKSSTSKAKTSSKKTTPKKNKVIKLQQNKEKQFLNKEIYAVGIIGVSILLFVCVVAGENMGIIGNYVSIFLRHTFGIGAIALPIVLLIYGVQMLRHMEDEDLKRKAIIFIGFFITLISLAHTLKGWEPSSSLGDYISKCYLNGSLKNGGLVGAIFGGLLGKILGQLGAYIVLFAILVMLFIMATGKSIMEFLNGIGEFIDGVRENNDYEEEYYELKAIREDEKAVSEKVEDEDDTKEKTENKKDDGSSEVEEDASDEVEEERDTRKSVKRKGGFLGLFKRREPVQEKEEKYVPPVVTFEIGEYNKNEEHNEELELDNCDVVNQRYNYLHRPREFDESIPRLRERVKQAQEAIARGEEKQYVSKILNGIQTELDKYSEKSDEKSEESENVQSADTSQIDADIPSLKEEIKGAGDIFMWDNPKTEEKEQTYDNVQSFSEQPENNIDFGFSSEPQNDYADIQHSAVEENNGGISSGVLEITPIEENPDLDTEKIALDALKSINKPSIQIISDDNANDAIDDKEAINFADPIRSSEDAILSNNIEEKEPKIFNESENVEENISDEVEEKSSVPRSMFTESIFKSGDSKNETSLAGKNFSYSEPEFIEAEEEKKVSKLTNQAEAVTIPYQYPKIEFLAKNPDENSSFTSREEKMRKVKKLEETLAIFGVEAKVNNISQGPAVTRFELTPPVGVRVNKIEGLADDIALALAAKSIRIEAPIPGMSAVGIEIPNDKISNVFFREILQTEKFNSYDGKIAFGMGKDIAGNIVVSDISKMPHLLIAGATGSGKSVCVNTIITSMLYKYSPDEVRLILVDPKVVELSVYNGIPHLLIPVVTDPHKAAGALNWAVREMMRRYDLFASTGSRKLEAYNKNVAKEDRLPQIVIIIDELADLMMVAKKEVEDSIVRLTQLARAAGIYLIVATQRPSVNVITGLIKANIPSRIAFKVSSPVDSRTILDCSGAEKLLGRGDMLFRSVSMDKPLRIQGAFVSDDEVEKIVDYIRVDESHYDQEIIKQLESSSSDGVTVSGGSGDGEDELTKQAIGFLVHSKKASISGLQRKFKIGYNRAANIIEDLEERGIVGPDNGGTKGREVLMSEYEYKEWLERNS